VTRGLLVLAALTALAGCRLEQSGACAAYISCQAAYDDALDLDRVDTERFSAEGDCWTHPDVADDCTQICSVQTDALANAAEDAGLDLPECE
jgi:hypothetical protein